MGNLTSQVLLPHPFCYHKFAQNLKVNKLEFYTCEFFCGKSNIVFIPVAILSFYKAL